MKNKGIYIGAGLALAILVVASFTVLSKAWWARRINAKWIMQHTDAPDADAPEGSAAVLVVEKLSEADARKYGLAELMRMYFKGKETWELATPAA